MDWTSVGRSEAPEWPGEWFLDLQKCRCRKNKNSIKVIGKLGGEQDGSLEIHLSIVESPEELDALLKMPPFSEKEEDREKTKDNDSESFDAFLARQPHNPRPRLIYQPEKDLLEKDEREGTMGRFENMYLYL